MKKLQVKSVEGFYDVMFFAGYTQSKLARETEITREHMHRIVNGKQNPSIVLAKKMSDILGKSVEELFDIKEG